MWRHRVRRIRRQHVFSAALLLIVAALIISRPATIALHTLAFTGQMLPGPLKIQGWLTREPERSRITFLRHDGMPDEADIYAIPGGKPRAAVLLFIGATEQGLDDPEVVKLGWALARTGFVVMFYWSEVMGLEFRLDDGDAANVVAAFEHLAGQPYVDPDRLGMAGFSVGASYAMVAAADPRLAGEIAFINSFGGYHDGADLLVQIAAGRTRHGDGEIPWEVHELTEKVFTNTVLSGAPNAAGDAFLAGADSIAAARRLYEALPDGFRSDVATLSPSRYVRDWNGDTVIRVMHDRGDTVIPVGESRRLAGALERERPDIEVYYTETGIFEHTSPDAGSDWRSLLSGAWQVFRHMYHIIAVAR